MSESLLRKMPPPMGWAERPDFWARARHKLAAHLPLAPFNATSSIPAVSFTFDDCPVSAATEGAALLEEAGACGTYYIASGLLGRQDRHWQVIGPQSVIDLHARGHEIACHSHGHVRADRVQGAAIEADIVRNLELLRAIEPSLPLRNFAYPFGQTTMAWKFRLKRHFRSSRGIRPRFNAGATDAQFLNSLPLMDREIDESGIMRALEKAAQGGSWLIFYTHDVTAAPSPFGCSPRLMRHALAAASRFGVRIETVDAALDRLGVRG